MTNPLVYKDNSDLLPEDHKFKISPSKFANFVTRPHDWYRSEILKEDVFTGNTSSVLGTVCHHIAEVVAKEQPVDKSIIEEYIALKQPSEEYDPDIVSANYMAMSERLVNDYVLENMSKYFEIEKFHYAEVDNGYYVAGTADFLEGSKGDCLIGDYKTYNSKTKPRAIPMNYKYQLLTLAYLLRANGYNPTRIRLVYINRHIKGQISEKTGKQMKSYPPEVTVLTETITDDDFEFIESLLNLCVDSCEASKAHPELTHVIWHDNRLKV